MFKQTKNQLYKNNAVLLKNIFLTVLNFTGNTLVVETIYFSHSALACVK